MKPFTIIFFMLLGLYSQSIYSQSGVFNDRSGTSGTYSISLNSTSSELTIYEKIGNFEHEWIEKVKMMSKSEYICEVYSRSGKYVLYYYWNNGRYDYKRFSEMWYYPHIGDDLHYQTKN